MSVTYALYESESREFIELGKPVRVDGSPAGFQRPEASIARFIAERLGGGSSFTIVPDTQDPPPGDWREVMAEEWPGSRSDDE